MVSGSMKQFRFATKDLPQMKNRAYYTLLINDGAPGEPWGIAFGDYDARTVKLELIDYLDHGWTPEQLKIINTASDDQTKIDNAVAHLNACEERNV